MKKPGVIFWKQKRQGFWKKLQQQFDLNAESKVVAAFQVSRHQTIFALRYVLLLLVIPLLVNQATKVIVVDPLSHYFESHQQIEVRLEGFQEERILKELQTYKSRLRFESLLQGTLENSASIEEKLQSKALILAEEFREGNIQIIKNIAADFLSLIAFLILILRGQTQLKILKQFLSELAAGLSDSAKAFLIILISDIFVGFHSSYGWDVFLNGILAHFGLPEDKQFVGLVIATFPVTLDAIGKYWIFRYLNQVSPSAVVTYRSMNE